MSNLTYFAGDQSTLGEISAGTLLCRLPQLGVDLTHYLQVQAWSERLQQRPAWQQIELSSEEWMVFQRWMRLTPRFRERRRRQRMQVFAQRLG